MGKQWQSRNISKRINVIASNNNNNNKVNNKVER
jgi:hypothetical protein